MASMTSSVSGTTTTYVITDQVGNSITVTAPAAPAAVTFSGSGQIDAMAMLSSLVLMLQTGLRPNVIANTTASTSN